MSIFHIVLIAAVATPFVLAGWAAFLHRDVPGEYGRDVRADPAANAGILARRKRFEAERLELEPLLRDLVEGLAPLARSRATRLVLAVSPGRVLWADREWMTLGLREVITTGICASPGGQVLISVLPLADELLIAVTDDALAVDQTTRESMARGASEIIAMQGGRLVIETRPGHGTTVTLRMPSPAGEVRQATPERAMTSLPA
jgi:signal transduction histidine kinase